MTKQVDTGPNLLLDWQARDTSSRVFRAGLGSVVAHAILLFLLVILASLDISPPEQPVEVAKVHKIVTPLIAPPTPLTQKEPNRGKVPKEVRLENLLPEKQIAPRIPAPPQPPQNVFKAPPHQNPAPPAPKPAPVPLQEAPRIEASLKPPQVLPPSPVLPPPKIQPVEQPKLALESPGQNGDAPQKGGMVKIPMPKASVEDAVHSIARGGGGDGGGIVVGDADSTPSLGDQLRRAPTPGRTSSSLQILSDPMGVDFKPYLIRILATVRRNWFAVIPESVRLGRRGKVTLQFAIDRSGGVPKLVIAIPSGAESLDRAAVAGISASVPFPPLPKEFPGQQIRLQFSFQYNQ